MYRSNPLRQAGLLHFWRCRNGGLQQAHVDRKSPTSDTSGRQGNPPEHNLLAGDFSRLASFRSYAGDVFLLTGPLFIEEVLQMDSLQLLFQQWISPRDFAG